jgi:hypothetical protein
MAPQIPSFHVDFREAAVRHWDDAHLLTHESRFANADQLFGLAAECALKAVMIALGAQTDPQGDFSSKLHVNDLWDELNAFAAGRQGARYLAPLARFADNPFADWQTGQRYAANAHCPSDSAAIQHHTEACHACLLALQISREVR